jgi:hypothetical protein
MAGEEKSRQCANPVMSSYLLRSAVRLLFSVGVENEIRYSAVENQEHDRKRWPLRRKGPQPIWTSWSTLSPLRIAEMEEMRHMRDP